MAGNVPDDKRWNARLAELRVFLNEQGRSPQQNAVTLEERRIAFWVGTQRKKRPRLTRQRVAAVEAVPGWTWRVDRSASPRSAPRTPQQRWDAHLDELRAFRAKHRRWPLYSAADPFERKLAKWIGHQSRSHRSGALSGERATALQAVDGWRWPSAASEAFVFDARWNDHLASLERFVNRHRRLPKASDGQPAFKLRRWADRQRKRRATGTLSDVRIAALERIAGWRW